MRFASSTRPAFLMSLSLVFGAAGVWSCGSDGETSAGPTPGGAGGSKPDSSADASGGTAGAAGGSAGAAGSSGAKDAAPDSPTGQQQCGVCTKDTDCASGFKCVESPLGDLFCAFDCSSAACPSADYECVSLATWGQDAGTAGAAGSEPDPDASVDDASIDDAASESSSKGGAGGGGPSGGKACVPTGGATCPCTAAREGVKRDCFSTNEHGTCTGKESCKAGSWQGCDAVSAQKEICDNKDNNCNGAVDMDEPGITGNQLCAGGLAPPHSGFSCVMGTCELSGCETGWTRYPASTPQTDGCNCAIDPPDMTVAKNDACSGSTDQGSIVDVGSQPKVIQGTLSSDSDVDWYGIVATDQKEDGKGNSFWVHVEFQSPDGNPGDEFRFEVIRSAAGGDACDATNLKTDLTAYDWCANSGSEPSTWANADSTATYRLKVYRKAGAAASCKPYKVKVSNGGATPGGCPADDGCGM